MSREMAPVKVDFASMRVGGQADKKGERSKPADTAIDLTKKVNNIQLIAGLGVLAIAAPLAVVGVAGAGTVAAGAGVYSLWNGGQAVAIKGIERYRDKKHGLRPPKAHTSQDKLHSLFSANKLSSTKHKTV